MNKGFQYFLVSFLFSILLAIPYTSATEIVLEGFSHSRIVQPRYGNSIIIVDYINTKTDPYPKRALLYKRPFDFGKGKKILAADYYRWSPESNWFITQKWAPDLDKSYPVLKTIIVIYDSNGNKLPSPGFGTSPTFSISKDTIYYFSEFSEKGEKAPPKLMSYNIPKKEKKILYTFEEKYTFWLEQIDKYIVPKPVYFKDEGFRGSIRLKGNLSRNFTFVISENGELKTWLEGNQTQYSSEESDIFQSRDGRAVIVVEYENCEVGPCPEKAMLYKMPLNNGKGKKIIIAGNYEWFYENNWIVTQQWAPDLGKYSPVLKTSIVIYDSNGNEQPSPGFGTSPTFLSSKEIYYFSEFSEKGEKTPPKLMSYNIHTKKKETIYTFEDKYTFWYGQKNANRTPKPGKFTWGGFRGTIRLKKNLEKNFTFVISGTAINAWYEGDLTHRKYPPDFN